MVVIKEVYKGSHADKAGIRGGDTLVSVNSHEIRDVLDYRYRTCARILEIECLRNGEVHKAQILKNDEYDDIGLDFDTYLMDEKQTCKNKCIFCFIDQNPPGMRESIYFKDDDSRLSFLMGNYVTLTNMTDADIDRIIEMKMSPVNISVHTMNPELRCKMLNNRFAGEALDKIKRFYDAGLEMNGQIVLCKGINDGKYLEKTIKDLRGLYPAVRSVSIVPVGLSKYRDKLTKLEGFDKASSHSVIKLVEPYQKEFKKDIYTSLVYLADEFYINAGVPIPEYEHYEEFPQIENGVGLIAAMRDEIDTELDFLEIPKCNILPKTIATSYIAYDFICDCVSKLKSRIPSLNVEVVKIKNNFFGDKITVTGLLCGSDIISQLQGNLKNNILLLSESMFKSDEDIFLDDTTLCDVENKLGVKVIKTPNTGYGFIKAILKTEV
mgnify:CR=1 FL=1